MGIHLDEAERAAQAEQTTASQVEIKGPQGEPEAQILTPEAVALLGRLSDQIETTRRDLLARRVQRLADLRAGKLFDFLLETASVRAGKWTVAPIPPELQDRRIEITGPVDRKMGINALNSGANCFMADFEVSNSPTWRNSIDGQFNLRDAVRGTIEYQSPEGKQYKLGEKPAILFVRPRGWHHVEKHVLVKGFFFFVSLFVFCLF